MTCDSRCLFGAMLQFVGLGSPGVSRRVGPPVFSFVFFFGQGKILFQRLVGLSEAPLAETQSETTGLAMAREA